MTVQVDIFTLIFLGVVIVIAAFLVPLLWQIKKTAKESDLFLSDLRRELIPTLKDVREISDRINRASVKIEKGSVHVENLIESLDEIVGSIRQDACRLSENAAFLILGIKAASKVLFKETEKKGD